MAIVLFEKGKGEVVTAPVIRSEIGGGRVQISGRMTTMEANDTALLLRAGSLAAPMEIIEEYTIGPSLGADNIERGINSVVWGMVAIAAFMCVLHAVWRVFHRGAVGERADAAGNFVHVAKPRSPCLALLPWRWRWAWRLTRTCSLTSAFVKSLRAGVGSGKPRLPLVTTVPGRRFWTQRHHLDCGPGFAGFWFGPGAWFCRGALHWHFDQHVLGRVFSVAW